MLPAVLMMDEWVLLNQFKNEIILFFKYKYFFVSNPHILSF